MQQLGHTKHTTGWCQDYIYNLYSTQRTFVLRVHPEVDEGTRYYSILRTKYTIENVWDYA